MITRRGVLLAGGIGLLVAGKPSRGQPAANIRRVGCLSLGSKAGTADFYAVLKQGMQDLGWLEGKNVEYQMVYADSDVGRLDALARDLVGRKVDVIVVGNATTTRALQRATRTTPIVMSNVNDPVGNGLVTSLAKPGGNITGITTQGEEVQGKLIGILHEAAPNARRIAFMLNDINPNYALSWATAQRNCSALGLVALRVVANTPAQFGAAVDDIVRQQSQAVVVVTDPIYSDERVKLHASLEPTHLPVGYGWREHVVAGGLLSYAPDLFASFRSAAKYVDKILKGARPADLPVEQVNKFELVINLKTAKALGLTIPQPLLLRADEVIQ